jgi:hypothetical protein
MNPTTPEDRRVSLEDVQRLAAQVQEKARQEFSPAALWHRYKVPLAVAGGALALWTAGRVKRRIEASHVSPGEVAVGVAAAGALGAMLWAARRAEKRQKTA